MGRITATVSCTALALSLLGSAATAATASAAGPPGSAARTVVAATELPLPPSGQINIGYSVVTQGSPDGTGHLVLVGPDGGRRTLGTTAAYESVVDLSNDARTVLTAAPVASGAQSISTWNLTAGTKTSWTIGPTTSIAFVAGGVLTVDYATGTTQVRSAVNGSVLTTFPMVTYQSAATVTPEGDLVLQRIPAGIAVRRPGSGSIIRTVPDAPGYYACQPQQLWTDVIWVRSWVMSCQDPADQALPRQYRVSFASGTVSAVTPPGAAAVWNTTPLRVASIPEATGIPNYLASVSGDSFGGLHLPGEQIDPHHHVIAAHGSAIWLLWNGEGGISLRRYDLDTKVLTTLIGPGSSSSTYVTSARTVDALT